MEDGDANIITKFVHEQFDYVYSSHCLEHMKNPKNALAEWWQLVKPGGHLMFIVPDEDLYEQGIFPSRFNPDHKATFTVSKRNSWSPVSFNVYDLALGLPGSRIVSIELQDQGYDRKQVVWGTPAEQPRALRIARRLYLAWRRRTGREIQAMEAVLKLFEVRDQTQNPATLAQIQCIVQKLPFPA